jgi:hypothetical protein
MDLSLYEANVHFNASHKKLVSTLHVLASCCFSGNPMQRDVLEACTKEPILASFEA